MIDKRFIDASMGPEWYMTSRTGGKVGPEIFGTGRERVTSTARSCMSLVTSVFAFFNIAPILTPSELPAVGFL